MFPDTADWIYVLGIFSKKNFARRPWSKQKAFWWKRNIFLLVAVDGQNTGALKPDFTNRSFGCCSSSAAGLYIDCLHVVGPYGHIHQSLAYLKEKNSGKPYQSYYGLLVTIPKGFPPNEAFHFSVWNSRYVLRSGRVPCQAIIWKIVFLGKKNSVSRTNCFNGSFWGYNHLWWFVLIPL